MSGDGQSTISKVWNYRFDIDVEVQGWLLIFATFTAMWLMCLPCFCAGLSCSLAKSFAVCLQKRLPHFLFYMAIFNMVFLYLFIHWMPNWNTSLYIKAILRGVLFTISHLLKWASSLAIIGAFCVAVAFKDRIALLLGLDHTKILKCKVRDCLYCWNPQRFQPIEVYVWKVEDLPSDTVFAANNVYVEFYLGYNETMRTRVRNNAGSDCTLKETIQLNFDQDDDEETLHIKVQNQQVVGAAELAHAEISTEKLKQLVDKARDKNAPGLRWDANFFREPDHVFQLIPSGKIWIAAAPITDEEYGLSSLVQGMSTC